VHDERPDALCFGYRELLNANPEQD